MDRAGKIPAFIRKVCAAGVFWHLPECPDIFGIFWRLRHCKYMYVRVDTEKIMDLLLK